jgi:uncharacterized protein DUF5994
MTSTQLPDADQRWSPRTRTLATEVPELVTRMQSDGFTVDRVMFNLADWDATPRRAVIGGRTIKFGGFTTQLHDTITLVDGSSRNRVTVANDAPAG